MKAPVVLVTGASRGIGAATALAAARAGFGVVVNFHSNAAAAQAVVREIQAHGGHAIALQADVAQEDQVLALFAAIDSTWGAWMPWSITPELWTSAAGSTPWALRALGACSRPMWWGALPAPEKRCYA